MDMLKTDRTNLGFSLLVHEATEMAQDREMWRKMTVVKLLSMRAALLPRH